MSDPPSSEPLLPPSADAAPILWSGRPEVGPRAPDLLAGLASGLTVFAVLAAKLVLFDVRADPPTETLVGALTLAGGYGAVWGLATALARAATGGWLLRQVTPFVAAVAVGARVTGQEGAALAVALAGAVVVAALLVLRALQRRNLRYQVTARGALIGERGRYVIAFPVEALPAVRPDRFGAGLAQVEFAAAPATLTTEQGRVFQVSPRPRQFLRVRDVEGLRTALETATRSASQASQGD